MRPLVTLSCAVLLTAGPVVANTSAASTAWVAASAPAVPEVGMPASEAPPDSSETATPEAPGSGPARIDIPTPELIDLPSRNLRRQRPTREPRREPTAYLARSLVLPGWGQDALGASGTGARYGIMFGLAVPIAFGVFGVPLIDDDDASRAMGMGLWASTALLAGVDAWQRAERINRENGYDLDEFELGAGPARPPTVRITLWHGRF